MRKLKLLMIGPFPYEPLKVIGGVEAVVSTLANSLIQFAEIDHLTIFNFFLGPKPAKHEIFSEKLDVFHYPAQKRLALITRCWINYLKIKKYCRSYTPDIVHGQGIRYEGDLAIRLGAKSVVSIHGMVHLEDRMKLSSSVLDSWRIRLVDNMVNRILNHATVTISTSSYDYRSLSHLIAGDHVLIANPVSAEFFETRNVLPENHTILFAGVMTSRKNMTGLIRSFKIVYQFDPSARLVIVGPRPDPGYFQEVLTLVQHLNLAHVVEFRGFLENPELIASLAQSRCLVLFSNEETSPTIIAQAMAVGKPIVATRIGGIPELVDEGKGGFLVDAGDEILLSQNLIRILSSDDLTHKMGTYNHQAAFQRSNPDEIARQTIHAYQLALKIN